MDWQSGIGSLGLEGSVMVRLGTERQSRIGSVGQRMSGTGMAMRGSQGADRLGLVRFGAARTGEAVEA